MRGLSDRDIEAALREALGDEATVSKSTVSRICEQIKDEFAKWRTCDLSDVAIDYLFVDASHFKMHDGARSEPVLAAYGITTEGNPVLLHLDGVSAESTDACVAFLEGMVARGLTSPVLTATDGAPGLCTAIDQVFPRARRQRCLIHRSRNCLAKVSEIDQDAVRADFWEIFDIDERFTPGDEALGEARRRARQFEATWGKAYPGAVACVTGDLDDLIAHLHYPRAHWPRIRHTNLISDGPSARPAAGSRSSVGCPGNGPHCRCCGPCSTAPPAVGAASPTPPPMSGYCR